MTRGGDVAGAEHLGVLGRLGRLGGPDANGGHARGGTRCRTHRVNLIWKCQRRPGPVVYTRTVRIDDDGIDDRDPWYILVRCVSTTTGSTTGTRGIYSYGAYRRRPDDPTTRRPDDPTTRRLEETMEIRTRLLGAAGDHGRRRRMMRLLRSAISLAVGTCVAISWDRVNTLRQNEGCVAVDNRRIAAPSGVGMYVS